MQSRVNLTLEGAWREGKRNERTNNSRDSEIAKDVQNYLHSTLKGKGSATAVTKASFTRIPKTRESFPFFSTVCAIMQETLPDC